MLVLALLDEHETSQSTPQFKSFHCTLLVSCVCFMIQDYTR